MFNFQTALEEEPEVQEQATANLPAIVPLGQGYDLTPIKTAIKAELSKYDNGLAQMEKEGPALKVVDPVSEKRAVELMGGSKTLHKSLKGSLDALIGPANEYVKAIRNLFNPYLDRLTAIAAPLKKKTEDYSYQQRLEQQRREAAAREEARKRQAEIDAEQARIKAEAERKVVEAAKKLEKEKDEAKRAALQKIVEEETVASQAQPIVVVAPVIEEKPTVTRTETGSGHLRMTWDFEIVDSNKIPRKYLKIDETAIRADVRAGIRQIDGLHIFEKPVMAIRT